MIKILFSVASFLFISSAIRAQSSADSVVKHSPVRIFTYQQYQAYLKGEASTDMARVAEMNHYPMPDAVLRYRVQLDLSPSQIKKIGEINTYMHRRRLQTGGSIIANEKMLDSLFRTHRFNEGNLTFYANRYGLYEGELRNAVLQACLATEQLLSPQQITLLESLHKAN